MIIIVAGLTVNNCLFECTEETLLLYSLDLFQYQYSSICLPLDVREDTNRKEKHVRTDPER
jgi:hypothetical protein